MQSDRCDTTPLSLSKNQSIQRTAYIILFYYDIDGAYHMFISYLKQCWCSVGDSCPRLATRWPLCKYRRLLVSVRVSMVAAAWAGLFASAPIA